MRIVKNIIGACALMALIACALSPQTIMLQPVLQVDANKAIGKGRTIALEVVDIRPSPTIGSRGGVYPETSTITTTGDVTPAIQKALSAVLGDYQFVVVDAGADASLKMKVSIDSIDYVASGAPRVSGIQTTTVVSVVCVNGRREFTGQYKGTSSKNVITPPDTEENQQLINEALAKVLDRVLSDEKLLEFMST